MIKIESEFVSYQIALRMKQLGFNENCYRVGNPNGAICWRFMDVAGVEGVGIDDILQVYFDERWVEIPTFSQAFRWFRENFGLFSSEVYDRGLDNGKLPIIHSYSFRILNLNNFKDFYGDTFKTYEEAEIGCLEKLIEIVEFKLNVK